MLKQTIQYKDFNGETVQEDFYFNFTMLEMIEQVEVHGVNKKIEQLTAVQDGPGAYLLFKGIVLDAYGIKSPDGKKFDKSPTIRHDFETSAAISELIIGFLSDADKGVAFIKGVLPEEMLADAVKQVELARQAEQSGAEPTPGIQQLSAIVEAPAPPVAPVRRINPDLSSQTTFVDDETAAARRGERDAMTPLDTGVAMSTSEKRQYTPEELEAIQGVPGTVPTEPTNPTAGPVQTTYTDEQVLAMSTDELVAKNLLQRAYILKTSGR